MHAHILSNPLKSTTHMYSVHCIVYMMILLWCVVAILFFFFLRVFENSKLQNKNAHTNIVCMHSR